MKKNRMLRAMREIVRALQHLNCYEPPQPQQDQLSRREASRRFKENLMLRYRTPNRCC
ncbi:MAG TPA: hypothetical protein VMT61_00500 [Candidatus Binataceae bacterium]|nr:hypothetical protein [Candidatus Binataceae bacterium]